MIQQSLEKIGLSEKEAKVYMATLELGEAPVQKIAEKSGVNRATTYVILENLMERGIVSTSEKGKKRVFVANGPQSLMNIVHQQDREIQRRKQKLDRILPRLKKIHNVQPNRPIVRYYEGKEALQSIREQFLEIKSKQFHEFYSLDEVSNLFNKFDRLEFRQRRQSRDVEAIALYNPGSDGATQPAQEGLTRRMLVPKDKYHFPCDIAIFDDFVSIAILSGPISGIVIESEAIANTFRSIFKLASKGAEKYQPKEVSEEAANV